MKVALVTMFTPSSENIGGPSALPYYLIKHKINNVELGIFSLNMNNVNDIDKLPESLPILFCRKIDIVGISKILNHNKLLNILDLLRINTLPKWCYLKIKESDIKILNDWKPDIVWIYPHTFNFYWDQFNKYPKLLTGPDSISLLNHRLLKDLQVLQSKSSINKVLKEYFRSYNMERRMYDNAVIHFVGLNDYRFFKEINKNNRSYYTFHPHYNVQYKAIDLNKTKLDVLISGGNNIYTKTEIDNVVKSFIKYSDKLKENITLTFLGKGWCNQVNMLRINNYKIIWKDRVENYSSELIKYDVQVFPISFGTGTKGKVLDAISHGLLSIGTEYAFENICVKNHYSCIKYTNTDVVCNTLINIIKNPKHYEQIAERGRSDVMKYHNPEICAKNFFRLMNEVKL